MRDGQVKIKICRTCRCKGKRGSCRLYEVTTEVFSRCTIIRRNPWKNLQYRLGHSDTVVVLIIRLSGLKHY